MIGNEQVGMVTHCQLIGIRHIEKIQEKTHERNIGNVRNNDGGPL